MKALLYPADEHACGAFRMTWPGRELAKQGFDVDVVTPGERAVSLTLKGDVPVSIKLPAGVDVVVLQRVTNRYMAGAIPLMRKQGVAVVVDVDDDLTCIDPRNPAFQALHPKNEGLRGANGEISHHSWHHLTEACAAATMITATTPALVQRYKGEDRGRVIPNYLPDHYYGIPHEDSETIGWPASLMSHPSDPEAVGNAVARMVNERGAKFWVPAHPKYVGRAFGLSEDPEGILVNTPLEEWPAMVSRLGIGIAPLVPTKFNTSKSWLKPLEMSAVGVPWVASPLPEYQRLHDLGAGLLAGNKRQWFNTLKALQSSPEMRKEQTEAGRDVAEMLRLKDHAWKYWEAWEDAVALERQ